MLMPGGFFDAARTTVDTLREEAAGRAERRLFPEMMGRAERAPTEAMISLLLCEVARTEQWIARG